METKEKGCLQVQKYNAMMQLQWHADCEEKSKEGRWSEMPQLAFYLFIRPDGQYCKTGYVAWSRNTAILRPTKRGAVNYLKVNYGVTVE